MTLRQIGSGILGFYREHRDLVNVGLLLALALAIRLPYMARPLHGDEMRTFVKIVEHQSLVEIITEHPKANNHILNSMLMRSSLVLFGEAPWILRLHNLFFGLLSIWILYLFSRKYFNRTVALITAILFSIHPGVILYSVWGRGYSGLILFTLLSSFFFLNLLKRLNWRDLVLYLVVSILAILSHLFAVNVLIAQGCLVLLVFVKGDGESGVVSRLMRLGPLVLSIVAVAVAVAGVYGPVFGSRLGGDSVSYAIQWKFPIALVNYLGGLGYVAEPRVLPILVCLVAIWGFIFALEDRFLRSYILILFLAPACLYFLSMYDSFLTLHMRFFIFLVPFYLLLVSAAIVTICDLGKRTCSGWIQKGTCISCIVIGAIFAFSLIQNVDVRSPKPEQVESEKKMRSFFEEFSPSCFLTNNRHFLDTRFGRGYPVGAISSVRSIEEIERFLGATKRPTIFYVFIPQHRYSARNLIHYKKKESPEELYRRSDELGEFLDSIAIAKEELPRIGVVYTLKEARGE